MAVVITGPNASNEIDVKVMMNPVSGSQSGVKTVSSWSELNRVAKENGFDPSEIIFSSEPDSNGMTDLEKLDKHWGKPA